VEPTFTYGSEIWTLTKKQEARIETAEMNFLRSVAGYKRIDQMRNSKIREELKIFNLNDKILNFRSQWKNYVLRMEDGKIPKKIQPKRKKGYRMSAMKMEGPVYSFKRTERAKYGLILEEEDDDLCLYNFVPYCVLRRNILVTNGKN
jgi:hypothetical protein